MEKSQRMTMTYPLLRKNAQRKSHLSMSVRVHSKPVSMASTRAMKIISLKSMRALKRPIPATKPYPSTPRTMEKALTHTSDPAMPS